jgi:hypothetical protein
MTLSPRSSRGRASGWHDGWRALGELELDLCELVAKTATVSRLRIVDGRHATVEVPPDVRMPFV